MCMSFFFLGLVIVVLGAYFLRVSIKRHDKEGKFGSIGLLIAGFILMLFFGIFYRALTVFGP